VLPARDLELLGQAVGSRALAIALASELRYVEAPTLSGGVVRAVLGARAEPVAVIEPPGAPGSSSHGDFRIALRARGPDDVSGECSRCPQVFGPCQHVTLLAVDLVASASLREALLAGGSTADAAAHAPEARAVINAELHFDRALSVWLSPVVEVRPVEIAASPFAEVDGYFGAAYGERPDARSAPVLAVIVRYAGERKLLAGREIAAPLHCRGRDRRVLEHTRDRGTGRKAVYAVGVEAALAIDAMRAHQGVFAHGFKGLLDFRAELMRPTLALAPHAPPLSGASQKLGETQPRVHAPQALERLSASWATADGAVQVAFTETVFFPGPVSYVWAKSGAIYRVAADVDLDFTRRLAQAPTLLVPRARLRDAGARLIRAARGGGIVLPEHEAFGLPPVETPRIVLRLGGEPLAVTGELVALYRAREVTLIGSGGGGSGAALAVPPVIPGGDERDLDHEGRARAHIEQAGLVDRAPDDEGNVVGERIGVTGEPAVAFWQTGLRMLQAVSDPEIEVQLTERLARIRIGAPVSGRVHVALEGDWLNARLEFGSKDLPVELSAIRVALSRKQRWVTLSDGTLARISASIGALADEAAAVMDGETQARLPPHQLGRLDRWLADNDGQMDASVEALRRRLRALAVAAEPDMPRGLRATLRPYQRLGLAWLQFLQALGAGGILADDMGLGKTITTLAFLLKRKQAEGTAPSLVVCPTSVATNWIREAARFTPRLRFLLLHGPSRHAGLAGAMNKVDVVVTTYALLRRDIEALSAIRFRCVVLDEAQNIKNADGATARAANRLDASMRLALSGTPVENRLRELWSLASFVNPGILGTLRSFETRFERPIAADRQSPVATELRAIVRPFLLRRTKDDVLPDLPPKTEIDRIVTLHERDKRMYDALAHTLRASIASDIEKRGLAHTSLSVFTALTRLRQMACDPRLVDPNLSASEAPSAKRGAFLDLVRELVSEGRRALVFSQFVQLLTLWRKDLDEDGIAYEYLDGATTKRDEVVDRFQNGAASLFLISLKAGGAGLNLTAADTVIHCDPWWNPAVEDQATDRAHRIGQDKPVTVVRLVASGTIEEKILSLKAKKRELTKAIVGDDARALDGITEEDIRALLGDASDEDEPRRPPAEALATPHRALTPDFDALVAETRQFLATSGMPNARFASLVDLPAEYVARLARGEPFPCSRAVADRIRRRLRAF
jgi:superfamily II DNA or RNA helicase